MTLYNNFWLKRGVGLFSGDYGISLPTGGLEETEGDALPPPSQGPRQHGPAGHCIQLPHPGARGGGGGCQHDTSPGTH